MQVNGANQTGTRLYVKGEILALDRYHPLVIDGMGHSPNSAGLKDWPLVFNFVSRGQDSRGEWIEINPAIITETQYRNVHNSPADGAVIRRHEDVRQWAAA